MVIRYARVVVPERVTSHYVTTFPIKHPIYRRTNLCCFVFRYDVLSSLSHFTVINYVCLK